MVKIRYDIVCDGKECTSSSAAIAYDVTWMSMQDYTMNNIYNKVYKELYERALHFDKYVICLDKDAKMLYGWEPKMKKDTLVGYDLRSEYAKNAYKGEESIKEVEEVLKVDLNEHFQSGINVILYEDMEDSTYYGLGISYMRQDFGENAFDRVNEYIYEKYGIKGELVQTPGCFVDSIRVSKLTKDKVLEILTIGKLYIK